MLKAYPPSGSGLRVHLDDRHWVEFIAAGTIGQPAVLWKPDGTLIDPPPGADPGPLRPDQREGKVLKADRHVLLQAVVPNDALVKVPVKSAFIDPLPRDVPISKNTRVMLFTVPRR